MSPEGVKLYHENRFDKIRVEPELSAVSRVDPLVMSDGDAELMSRVQTGDRGAFAVLVDRHKHRLVNYLSTLTRDRDRAEELAQDTFIRLFESAGRYDERGQLVPFLFRIATNLLRSEDRKKRRREVLLHMFSGNGHHRSDNGTSPQEELLRKEVGQRVKKALAGVPLRYRSPLVLREMEGWSYRDIASALNCREGTVKSRIHRGREELRRLLEPYWNGGRG